MNQKEFTQAKLEEIEKSPYAYRADEHENTEIVIRLSLVQELVQKAITEQAKLIEEMVKYQFRITEEKRFDDEIHCSCLGHCEWLIS